jgi:type I restriction enzyme S subunit
MEFKTYRFDEVTLNFDKKRMPLSGTQREKRRGSYRYYGAQGVIDYIDDYIFDGTYLLIAEDGENLKSKKQDIAQIATGQFWVNNHAHIVQGNSLCDTRFLYYLLNSMDLSGYVTGSAQPKLSQANLNAVSVAIPDIVAQRKIVDYLYAIDQKIDNNRRINDNLQQQAMALYASMFLDNPALETTAGTLKDIADITMGQSPSGSSYNEDGNGEVFYQGRAEFGYRFPTRRLFTTEPKRMAEAGDVLLSVRAPVGDLNVAYERCCIGRGLGAIHGRNGYQSFVLYTMFALRPQLDVYNGEGTVFGSIKRNALNDMPIDIPPEDAIAAFEAVVRPMDDMIRANYEENCRLQELRDSLLPRLMSGEVDVSDIDI